MNSVRLSICIATLNRAAYIGETLQSIVSQAGDEVEIVVVDGASTDNTEEVVRNWQTHFPRLHYVRLEQKGGVDQDYCKAVTLARGEYCWLFTDDDLLKPGAVQAVLAATRKNYSLIIVNCEVRTPDLKVCLQPRRVIASEDRVYAATAAGLNELFADTGVYLSFIGGVVIKREVWEQRDTPKYFGSLFIHVGALFQSPLPTESLLIATPLIAIRYGNAQWTSRSFEIWMFKWPELVWSFPGLADWAKQKVEVREPWRSPVRLLLARATGQYAKVDYTRWLESRVSGPLQRLTLRTIATVPVGPLNAIAKFCIGSVLRKKPSMTLFDLERTARANRLPANRDG